MYEFLKSSFPHIIVTAYLVNGYLTNAPSPLKSPSYERTKKFKCPVHSCKGLEL